MPLLRSANTLVVLLFVAALLQPFAAALASPQARTEHAQLELLVENLPDTAGSADQSIWAAIEITLDEGWHVYWKNPGDSGLEAEIKWDSGGVLRAGDIHWQAPKRIEYSGLFNYGYEGKTALLVPLYPQAESASAGFTLAASIEFLICLDVCIPQSASLSVPLPQPEEAGAAAAARIQSWQSQLPRALEGSSEYSISDGNVQLSIDLAGASFEPEALSRAWFFPLDDQTISNAATQQWRVEGSRLLITVAREGIKEPNPFRGVLALIDKSGQSLQYELAAMRRFAQATGAVNATDSGVKPAQLSAESNANNAPSAAQSTLLFALFSAFLGGLILNIMPCVLPVLSLKALSIAKKADTHALHLQGLAYTAGILVSFLAVAGTLIALQHAGESIGWGFQLQSAGFVSALIYVLFLVGLNLSGLFEIPSGFAGFGSALTGKDDLSGAFFTGVLATIVATPCTAPFMATAVGFALGQPSAIALLIFATLGLGLASPFLVITFVPRAARLLPKPGAWMERFKQFLAFPMYATVIWLLWVLTQQSGASGMAGTLMGMLLLAFTLWLLPLLRNQLLRLALIVACIAGLLSVTQTDMPPHQVTATSSQLHAGAPLPFSQSTLDALRAEGKAVFVNATAAWCITCKVNERVALRDAQVQQALNSEHITYLIADWTNRDAAIADYLARFGRNGVPLYVFYPAQGEPIVLPQLLTPALVLEALNSKGKTP